MKKLVQTKSSISRNWYWLDRYKTHTHLPNPLFTDRAFKNWRNFQKLLYFINTLKLQYNTENGIKGGYLYSYFFLFSRILRFKFIQLRHIIKLLLILYKIGRVSHCMITLRNLFIHLMKYFFIEFLYLMNRCCFPCLNERVDTIFS